MNFNRHSDLQGKHALLSPSGFHWIYYDDDKMVSKIYSSEAAARGTRLHDLARDLIKEGIKLPKSNATLNQYVNDAIGYRMTPEQVLFYSYNCFGTADALSFRKEKGVMVLRIHDLKNGVHEAGVEQLEIYAALFCLEYGMKPMEIVIEMKIYQNDQRHEFLTDSGKIMQIMAQIQHFDTLIDSTRQEATA